MLVELVDVEMPPEPLLGGVDGRGASPSPSGAELLRAPTEEAGELVRGGELSDEWLMLV